MLIFLVLRNMCCNFPLRKELKTKPVCRNKIPEIGTGWEKESSGTVIEIIKLD